ncbi:MAG: arginase family protein [Myxococcales bacterium]|nr:arginase family protein [Myxococcales bacterium]
MAKRDGEGPAKKGGTDTLRYVRFDTTRRPPPRSRDDLRMGSLMVSLEGNPSADAVQAILLGVASDRGAGLRGSRLGAVDGPQRFREYFWRLHAPEGWKAGSILDAGDLISAGRTDETHARLGEVTDVLRGRFPKARLMVIGGSQDNLYGEILGLGRWVRRNGGAARCGLVNIDARPDAFVHEGEPHDGTAIRRLLGESASQLSGENTVLWGLQRSESSAKHVRFLREQGVVMRWWPDLGEGRTATTSLLDELSSLTARCTAVALSVDLSALSQAQAPGVAEPIATGVPAAAIVRGAEALASSPCPTQLSIYGLNPRFDRDGMTGRLAARIAWSYITQTR